MHGRLCTDPDAHRSVSLTVGPRMVHLADNLPASIAALSELAGRGDYAFGEAGYLAAVAGEGGRALERRDTELRRTCVEDQQAQR